MSDKRSECIKQAEDEARAANERCASCVCKSRDMLALYAALCQSRAQVASLEAKAAHEHDLYLTAHRENMELATRNKKLSEKVRAIEKAATKWERCCDLWQDSMGGRACTECEQKTFAMMREVQAIIGVGKDCAALRAKTEGDNHND